MKAYQKKFRGPIANKRKSDQGLQLTIDPAEMIELLQQSVHTMGVEVGRVIAVKLLDDEVRRLCGAPHERSEGRRGSRHGRQDGWITLGGQKQRVSRPRVRGEGGEIELERYALMQSEEAMPEAVLRRLVRGVSCRDYAGVIDLARDAFGVRRSSVSRSFIEASREEIRELAEHRFDGVRFAVILIDGIDYADSIMTVALGIQSDGTKHLLGFREGASENAEVCTRLLEDLCERGLSREQAALFVLDGSKALRKAVVRLWGEKAVIQRCQIHKKRNIEAHVPKRHWNEIRERLSAAYHETNYERGLKKLKTTAALLDRIAPDAAASLREGMEETLTVIRLGLSPELLFHLGSTNIIESSLSTARKVSRNVKRWRDGDMRRRWCAAGLIEAEKKFRRIKGYKHMPSLIAALDRQATSSDSLRRTA